MTAPHGTVRYLRRGQTLNVRVEGWGTMSFCLPLRRLVEESLAAGVTALRFDLRECGYIDSTFLGTLLHLKRTAERGAGQVVLVSPSAASRQILEQLGLGAAYRIVDEELAAGEWAELAAAGVDVDGCRRNVVQAHQELAGLEGRAGERFREVARGMARAMEEADKAH